MKLNWFSPLPPKQTDIAEYTIRVLPALQKYAEVTLWTDQVQWSSEVDKYAKVVSYDLANVSWSTINQADLNIYHIGNNADFHHSIWQLSCRCSGMVVLHDFKLHHFFAGIYLEKQRNRDAYLFQMEVYYGIEGKQAAEKFLDGNLPIDYLVERYPLTYLAIENALGVMTHTIEAFNTIKKEDSWLVGYSPLPYVSKFKTEEKTIKKAYISPYKIIVFGHINTNRCLDIFLKALSNLSEKCQFSLDIYGHIWDENYIREQIESLEISNLVTIHGFVQEDKLDLALANAHLAVNLRYPTMGESSGSQLRIWSHKLPSLVTKVGWYAEQPEDTVAFVRPGYEIEDIQQYLRSFLANPQLFLEMGSKGWQIFKERHSPDSYAQSVVSFARKNIAFRHYSVAHKLVKKVGQELKDWSQYTDLNMTLQGIAEAIHFIST